MSLPSSVRTYSGTGLQEALQWHSLSLDAVTAEQEVTKTDMLVAPRQRALGTPRALLYALIAWASPLRSFNFHLLNCKIRKLSVSPLLRSHLENHTSQRM